MRSSTDFQPLKGHTSLHHDNKNHMVKNPTYLYVEKNWKNVLTTHIYEKGGLMA